MLNILILIAGLTLILGGANYLTDGSAAIAKRFNIPEFIIGLTIIAVGTSAPELVISAMSAIDGHSEMAIGNVVGSNIFNTLLILGLSAIFYPIDYTRENMKRDIPFAILASVVLLLVTFRGVIRPMFGYAMICIYIAIIYSTIVKSRRAQRAATKSLEPDSTTEETEPQRPMWLAVVMTLGGLAALIYGGDLFLDSAVTIAEKLHIPQNVIAITLLAGGTSLPELAASMVSLVKGKSDMALGNVIGSNVANILLVLGVSASITPLAMGSIGLFDIIVVLGSSILVFVAGLTLKRRRLDRTEGALMILLFATYIWILIK